MVQEFFASNRNLAGKVVVVTGETVLLFAGLYFERKGLECVVRALARLPTTVRLEVAGKGNAAPYQRIAKTPGVSNRLRFLGSSARMEEVYARSDILVHPAIYEPFSNTCLEAMACGLPVLTSRINGASEIVRSGENGKVVENPADISALAEAIEFFSRPCHSLPGVLYCPADGRGVAHVAERRENSRRYGLAANATAAGGPRVIRRIDAVSLPDDRTVISTQRLLSSAKCTFPV